MREKKGKLNICRRGHKFYKTSDCPICPACWSGYYREKKQNDFPRKIGAPALRALLNERILSVVQLSNYTENDIKELHGIGPKAMRELRDSLKAKGLSFKKK